MTAARDRLLELVRDRAVVHGRVTLSSGQEADYYVDLRRITLDGEAAPLVGDVMLDLVADLEIDAVGGLTMGADPVATAMLPAAHRRGLQRRIEGPDVGGRRVLVVEDTSTTGGSPLTAVQACRDAGAEVVAVAVIADRASGAEEKVRAAGVDYRAAYSLADLELG